MLGFNATPASYRSVTSSKSLNFAGMWLPPCNGASGCPAGGPTHPSCRSMGPWGRQAAPRLLWAGRGASQPPITSSAFFLLAVAHTWKRTRARTPEGGLRRANRGCRGEAGAGSIKKEIQVCVSGQESLPPRSHSVFIKRVPHVIRRAQSFTVSPPTSRSWIKTIP